MPRATGRRLIIEEPNSQGRWTKGRNVGKILARIVMGLVSVYLLYEIYVLLLYSDVFRIERVDVYGCRQTTQEEILARLPWKTGMSLWTVNLSDSVKSVLSDPWVKRVTIRRVLPRRIEIHIDERQVVAAIQEPDGFLYYGIDERGVILPSVPVVAGAPYRAKQDASSALPILSGFDKSLVSPGKTLPEERARLGLALIKIIQDRYPQLGRSILEYSLAEQEDVVAYPHGRVKKVHFGSEVDKLPERVARLAETWNYLEREGLEGESLDLRYDEQGVIFRPNASSPNGDGRAAISQEPIDSTGGKEA